VTEQKLTKKLRDVFIQMLRTKKDHLVHTDFGDLFSILEEWSGPLDRAQVI